MVTTATCTEQLLYEVHDPSAYVTPDVIADFSGVSMDAVGPDRVRVSGASGRMRPPTLKVSVGRFEGWIGEGQMSYGGAGAVARARLAADVVAKRLARIGVACTETRYDVIGMDALHRHTATAVSNANEPCDVRLRVAARTTSEADAWRVAREVESLYTNGPAGGGGATTTVRQVLAMDSTLVARDEVPWQVSYEVIS
jgi:hypothetical protein